MKAKKNILSGITAFALAMTAVATPLGTTLPLPTIAQTASADTYGDYSYSTYYPTGLDGPKTAIITGYNGSKDVTELTIPSTLDDIPVTEISWYNFNMPNLVKLTVPEGVTVISGGGFENCTALETVILPESLERLGGSFEGCTSLENINIPKNITYITAFLFSGCSSLVSVELPEQILAEGIPNGLFEDCTSLSTEFIQSVVDKTPSLGQSAFSGCNSLTELTVPESLDSISSGAFKNCTGLKSVKLLKTKRLSWPYFSGCTSLTDITVVNIDNKFASVFGNAIGNIKKITVLENPDVTTVSSREFSDFTALEEIKLPENILSIERNAFSDSGLFNQTTTLKYADNWVIGCDEDAEEVVIQDGALGIAQGAFDGATALTKVTVPGTFKNKTMNDALNGHPTLKEAVIKDGIETIAAQAFYRCTAFEDITIPDSVKNVGANAFYGTKLLEEQKDELIKYADDWAVDFEYDIPYKGDAPYDVVEEAVIESGTVGVASYAFADAYLRTIYIPSTVEYINNDAFIRASLLTDVYYEGTEEMFNNIVIGTGNECLLNAKIHYGSVMPCKVHTFGEWEEKLHSCMAGGTKTRKCTVCGEVETETVEAIGAHSWQSVEYTWSDDNSACTGKVSCARGDSSCSIQVKATVEVTTPATCTTAGMGVYTAAGPKNIIDDVVFETQTKTAPIPATGHNYTDKVVAPTTSAQGYTLHTCSVCGDSYKDNYKDKLTTPTTTTVAQVTGLKTAGRAADALRISWTKVANADGYIVEMYKSNKWTQVAKITKNTTTEWKQTGLAAGTAYKFRVKAYKGTTQGKYSAEYSSRTNPSKVSGLKLAGRANNALRIAWNKNTSADGYIVEMYKGGKWVRVAKISKNTTTEWKQTKLAAGTAYKFRVKAYKMSGSAALYGTAVEISARTSPSNVTGMKTLGRAKTAVRFGWTKNTSADGYIVEMYKGGKWVRAAKITSNSTVQFKKTGLKAGTTYKFRIKAYKMSGKTALYSGYTNISIATTK